MTPIELRQYALGFQSGFLSGLTIGAAGCLAITLAYLLL